MQTTLSHTIEHCCEFKKIFVAFAYRFAIELIFFSAAAIGICIMWFMLFHVAHISDRQNVYIYHPYEIKYITIIIGGIKRRVQVKRYLTRKKILFS